MVRVWVLTSCVLCASLPSGVAASDGLEFIPFVGHRFGGGFDDAIIDRSRDEQERDNWGFAIRSPASTTTRYELLYSHRDASLTDKANPQDTFDLDIDYLQLGGTVDVGYDRFIPFFSGGIGMAYMSPGRSGLNNETRLALSLGGGLKWNPSDRLGLLWEMRGYGALTDTCSSLLCDGGYKLEVSGDLFPQFETNLGLIFRF